MEALTAISTRRSTRKYSSQIPGKELIEQVIAAGRYAPSGGNSQTTHMLVFTDKEMLKTLAELVQGEFAKMEITEGMYASLKFSVSASKKGGYIFHYNAPVFIVVANKKGYGNAMADSACALENMMIAANALDLGSCYHSFPVTPHADRPVGVMDNVLFFLCQPAVGDRPGRAPAVCVGLQASRLGFQHFPLPPCIPFPPPTS